MSLRLATTRALLAAALAVGAAGSGAADDFSAAEKALFMSKQLASIKPPATLNYRFVKGGSMEGGFDDAVALKLAAKVDRSCCTASTDFLSGGRRLSLPEIEAAEGNPVLLYFLERDIREMSRLTKGQANYFRKRIRMAVAESAQIRELTLPYAGKTVAARQITISPYLDDPLRARFENLANKRYVFTLAEAVPGGVYAVATRVDGTGIGAPPLWTEELTLEGATPPPLAP